MIELHCPQCKKPMVVEDIREDVVFWWCPDCDMEAQEYL